MCLTFLLVLATTFAACVAKSFLRVERGIIKIFVWSSVQIAACVAAIFRVEFCDTVHFISATCVANLCVCKETLSFPPWNENVVLGERTHFISIWSSVVSLVGVDLGMENALSASKRSNRNEPEGLLDGILDMGLYFALLRGCNLQQPFVCLHKSVRAVLENMWFSIQTCSCLWTSVVYYSFTCTIVLVVLCSQQVEQEHNTWRSKMAKIAFSFFHSLLII